MQVCHCNVGKQEIIDKLIPIGSRKLGVDCTKCIELELLSKLWQSNEITHY